MVQRMVSNERPASSSQQQQRPQLHQMKSAVNKQPGVNLANHRKPQTEDELLESLENIDMLLANMRAGDS